MLYNIACIPYLGKSVSLPLNKKKVVNFCDMVYTMHIATHTMRYYSFIDLLVYWQTFVISPNLFVYALRTERPYDAHAGVFI